MMDFKADHTFPSSGKTVPGAAKPKGNDRDESRGMKWSARRENVSS